VQAIIVQTAIKMPAMPFMNSHLKSKTGKAITTRSVRQQYAFMNLTTNFRVCLKDEKQGNQKEGTNVYA
jgi:hypothetical protein